MFFNFKGVVNFLKFLFKYQYISKQMANYGRENHRVRVIAWFNVKFLEIKLEDKSGDSGQSWEWKYFALKLNELHPFLLIVIPFTDLVEDEEDCKRPIFN